MLDVSEGREGRAKFFLGWIYYISFFGVSRVMISKMHYIAAMLLMLVLPCGLKAQGGADMGEVEMMTKRYTDAYDSLIASYYLRQFSHSRLIPAFRPLASTLSAVTTGTSASVRPSSDTVTPPTV